MQSAPATEHSVPAMVKRTSFTVKEIAARNGISAPTVYAEINRGHLRSFKIGGSRRISVEAEREWISGREEAAAG